RFILDVLQHVTTYQTYYQLSKAIEDDPDVDEKKAKKAIARFMSLHPHNIAQKIEIIVEHYRQFTRPKINGRAKAMVVTRSRLHVVRYKEAFDAYIQAKGYTDINALVAFSGTVIDPDVEELSYTEASMNGISENELPRRFATPDYHLLIVAEKYQTGFDQPLLHTMFVDKRLADLQAVQTLSRLNRATSGKEDTFVLDFVNEIDEIQEAFKPYYEQTVIDQPTDPNQLYTLETKLRQAPILRQLEIDEFAAVFFKPHAQQTKKDHGQLNKWIDPAVARFHQEYTLQSEISEEGEAFKSSLQSYIRLYAFLSQVIDWQDVGLEKLYAYGRYLLTKLPYRSGSGMMVIDDEVELTAYRNEKTFEGSAALTMGETKPVYGPTEVGTRSHEDKKSPLSAIIALLNDRFGTEWTAEDQLLFEQISGDMVQDETLVQQARANSKEQFRQVFTNQVMLAFISRQGRNEQIVNEFMANEEMRVLVINALLDDVYGRVQLNP
ncbi:MAG: type I restriction endonuclease subunit R, partial [Anaerolineae bacterium]|nr:type I restriction endonuclease subunit R [Anaerolineae bacterium]